MSSAPYTAAPPRARLVQIGTRRPADGTDPALHQVNRSRRSHTPTAADYAALDLYTVETQTARQTGHFVKEVLATQTARQINHLLLQPGAETEPEEEQQ